MSDLTSFLKKNKKTRTNTTYCFKSFLDGKGDPIPWQIRPLTSKENEAIREECTIETRAAGRRNRAAQYRVDTNRYMCKLMAASVVHPDLNSAELQDSYGVKTPEDLIKEMIDNPGEYTEFGLFIQSFNGFDLDINDTTEQAKN